MTPNKLSEKTKTSLLARVISAFILVATLIPCIYFGSWVFFGFVFFITSVATYEVLTVPGKKKYPWYVWIVCYLFVYCFTFYEFIIEGYKSGFTNFSSYISLNNLFISFGAVFFFAIILFTIGIFDKKIKLEDITYLFMLCILLALGMQGLLFIRLFPSSNGILQDVSTTLPSGISVNAKDYFVEFCKEANLNHNHVSYLLFVFLIIGTWLSDVGAYFFGIFFGKHKMNERISPNKTWEGFIGGIFTSILFSLSFAAILEFGFNCPLVPGLVQFRYSPLLASINVFGGHAIVNLLFLAVIMPTVGNIGGFLYSLVKRHYQVKDYGNILPGHGGVIDRFDSVMINACCMSIVVLLSSNSWSLTI